eukprot:CAMPEP_0118885400 /NCGR_PEP_ID=MMETSP1163-20130328/23894_1 /TAXON_ID=124430 /ORGANISM="Phaeomonas parva, Strain CCMP2877" /LENGTH=34 /DNA_ID= /DNA_START= /DNA_END= /DNA_ORIENTATION=
MTLHDAYLVNARPVSPPSVRPSVWAELGPAGRLA